MLLTLAPAAPASVITVTRTDDPAPDTCAVNGCSLREAIMAAVDGVDTVRVPASGVPYDVTAGQLLVNKTIAIEGDAARSTTIRGDADNRVLELAGAGKTLAISNVTITGGTNVSSVFGGGIFVSAGRLELTSAAVTGNQVNFNNNASGGGIDLAAGTDAVLNSVTVAGNLAISNASSGIATGGGISNRGGQLTVTNSTISGNIARSIHPSGLQARAGGVHTGSGGDTTLNSSTVFGNSAEATGSAGTRAGNLLADSTVVHLKGTIVAAGSASIGPNCVIQGVGPDFDSQGGNIDSLNQCGLGAGDHPNTDPVLTALGDHGGQTDTHALAGPSLVVNGAGACGQPVDQRGFARTGPCDVGAFENQAPVAAASAVPGPPTSFDGSASSDPDRDPLAFTWAFDDGSSGAGPLVQHSFATSGTHTGTLTVRDPAGATGTAAAGVTVPAALPDLAPRITSLRFARRVFPAAPSGPALRAAARRYGSRVSYGLTEAARTTFRVQRARPGRRRAGRCVAPRPNNLGAPRCTRYVQLRGRFTHVGNQGSNRFRFTGRIGGRRLSPGRYRLVARPRDAAGNLGGAVRRKFRIIR